MQKIIKITTGLNILLLFILLLIALPVKVHAQVSNDWQKAASIVPRSTTDFSSASFRQSLDNLAATGANHVSLIIPYYQATLYSTQLRPGWNTPTDASLISAINHAHSLGMTVSLKPHAETDDGRWRGGIDPSDRAAWFNSYGNMLGHYAQIAQQQNVYQYVIGTEMMRMTSEGWNPTNTQYWRNMINDVRQVYTGKLTYSAQWSGDGPQDPLHEGYNIGFWDLLDYFGLSAYYPIAQHRDNPTVDEIVSSWQALDNEGIAPVQNYANLPLLITELGYRSIDGANKEPWSWWLQGDSNEQLQADLYEGFFRYWSERDNMVGVHLWDWDSRPDAGGPGTTSYTPQNKQAEGVMSQWFDSIEPPSDPIDPPGDTVYTVEGYSDPESPIVGQSVGVNLTVRASNNVQSAIVDIEIYDSGNNKIFQEYYTNQSLTANVDKDYAVLWVPGAVGEYTVKLGIFRNDWSMLYHWNDRVFVVTVSAPEPPSETRYTFTGSSSPEFPDIGQSTEVRVNVTASNQVQNVIVDLEIYNEAGQKIHQHYFTGQNFEPNTARQFLTNWTPSHAQAYTVKTGIFSNDWGTLYHWEDTVFVIEVGQEEVVYEMDIWWPQPNVTISGEQPLKAKVRDLSVNDYEMYWRLDGGELNRMDNDPDPYPHKVDIVDVRDWGDNDGEAFRLTFIARDSAGDTIVEETINVYVWIEGE
jgi:hypothetical protein